MAARRSSETEAKWGPPASVQELLLQEVAVFLHRGKEDIVNFGVVLGENGVGSGADQTQGDQEQSRRVDQHTFALVPPYTPGLDPQRDTL